MLIRQTEAIEVAKRFLNTLGDITLSVDITKNSRAGISLHDINDTQQGIIEKVFRLDLSTNAREQSKGNYVSTFYIDDVEVTVYLKEEE